MQALPCATPSTLRTPLREHEAVTGGRGRVDVEALLVEARRRALLIVIRTHPKWTLEQVLTGSKSHKELIASLTMRELWGYDPRRLAGLSISQTRYERASRLLGGAFDKLVLEVLLEADGPVQTGYLRARLGGPRWKVKGSLERLCAKGLVTCEGVTSATYYKLPHVQS